MQKTTVALPSGKLALLGACAVVVLAASALAPAALAEENGGGVTTADLGIARPGLLPTNPFYFVKEWTRAIRRAVIVDPVKRVLDELRVATEKAAELKRLEEVKGDARAIARAAENYRETMKRLTERLKALSATSENPNVDKLLDSLVARTLVHQQLLGELKAKYDEVKDDIEEVQKTVDEALGEIPRKIDSAEKFTNRLKEAIAARRESAMKELNAINVLSRLSTAAPAELEERIARLKDDLVLRFQGRVSAAPVSPQALLNFAGDVREKVLVIDEVRERVLDSELKNSLSQLRDRVLKESEDKNEIKEADAKRMIQSAAELAQKLVAAIQELGTQAPTSVAQLLLRANANIEQAETFYAAGAFGSAFGQATAAISAAKSAMIQLAIRMQDLDMGILELKQKFDELRARAARGALSRERNPKVFTLFDRAEQMIVSLPKTPSTAGGADRFVTLLRETKALLSTIEAAIKEAVEPTGLIEKPFPAARPAPVPMVCIQVIQPAKDPMSGACKEFRTPCDVPLGWVAVNACPTLPIQKEPAATGSIGTGTIATIALWTISMGDEGFFPAELKVRKGDKVIWVNKGAQSHWPASAVHPTHTLYPEFDAKQSIGPGASYAFVFDRVGSWNYHDHLNSGLTGVIVVVE